VKEKRVKIFRNLTHPPRNGNNITAVSSLLHCAKVFMQIERQKIF
jgi:hypothetical protein